MESAKLADRLKAFFSKDLKLKLIVGLGLLGMALILLSYFMGGSGGAPDKPPDDTATSYVADEYAERLEEKLSGLIAQIEGVGRNEVMVTLESGTEYVYAQQEKRNTASTEQQGEGEPAAKVNLTENIEQSYLLVDGEYGKKEALVLTELQPKIQGVVVVCEGADNPKVEQKLTSVVTTALGISSTKVCVVKIK